ncbi:MAG: L-alanine-DL-glutamate epimerase-like enolase superfamily enzyme [Acidimicrobiales bacterium]|jgi:L-alanine-DL-glutamate epimerase-like enolase superfamily enzyme
MTTVQDRITSHDVLVVSVPLDRPFMGIPEMGHVILRLRDAEGNEGLGWACAFDQALVPALSAATEAVAEWLTGLDPADIIGINSLLKRRLGYWGPGLTCYVRAIIDIAIHDLAARQAGVSVAAFLGARSVETVPVYASQHLWRDYDLDALHTGAGALAEQGWRAMKFRIGANNLASDEAERARVVREAVGPAIDVMVDVNQGWDIARTKEVAPLLEPYRLNWLEDPIDHRDIAGYTRLVREVGIPITHGEYHFDVEPFGRIAAERAADTVMIDAHHVGGIVAWMQAAAVCDVATLPVATHLSPEIGVHLAAAAPNCKMLEYMDWSVNLFNERIELDVDGRAMVPTRPGLGFTLDDSLVAARSVS